MTHSWSRRLLAQGDRRDERGAISVWFATTSLVMIILVGMAVDLGGKVHTQQRARSMAAQAARTGAQEVQGPSAVRGEDLRVDIAAAKSAAQDYLRAADVNGAATVTDGDTLVVRTTDTYDSKFLGIIGLDSMQVTGEASARLIRSEGGIER
jgi:Flp pilus assembly protein TadG